MVSLIPVTVTVCAMFQLALVKVNNEVDTVPSNVLLLLTAIVTFAVGAVSSTTENVAVPPASEVIKLEVGVTVTPGAVALTIELKENSELEPKPVPKSSVAISVTLSPAKVVAARDWLKDAKPKASVLTLNEPRYSAPSA